MSEKKMPRHVAIIMDGNGRWAKARMLPRVMGHNRGMKTMKEIVKAAHNLGIKYLTVYAFSTENWKRTPDEVSGLMNLVIKYVMSETEELKKQGVRVNILGAKENVPKAVQEALDNLVTQTAKGKDLIFNICFNYGGRREIIDGVNCWIDEHPGEKITEDILSNLMYAGSLDEKIPDPDLIIRTSGEERLSNFLLWQSAYSELAFTSTLWPDFTPEEFKELVVNYTNRERRFGGRLK